MFLRWFRIVFRDSIAHATLVYGAIVSNSVQTCVWPNNRPNNNDFPSNVCNLGAFGSEIGPIIRFSFILRDTTFIDLPQVATKTDFEKDYHL